jgi:hypothetical protein
MTATEQTKPYAVQCAELDAELADVLTAISVITRQLAKKITARQMSKEEN